MWRPALKRQKVCRHTGRTVSVHISRSRDSCKGQLQQCHETGKSANCHRNVAHANGNKANWWQFWILMAQRICQSRGSKTSMTPARKWLKRPAGVASQVAQLGTLLVVWQWSPWHFKVEARRPFCRLVTSCYQEKNSAEPHTHTTSWRARNMLDKNKQEWLVFSHVQTCPKTLWLKYLNVDYTAIWLYIIIQILMIFDVLTCPRQHWTT